MCTHRARSQAPPLLCDIILLCNKTIYVKDLENKLESNLFSLLHAAVNCRDLSDPNNGRVSTTGSTVGSKATYTCNKGFSLVGKNMRKCLASGQWMGEAPICKRKENALKPKTER